MQYSATSQPPAAAARQIVVDGFKLSKHVPVELQVSALSHAVTVALPHALPGAL